MTDAAPPSWPTPPPESTVERWAWDYLLTPELSYKLEPPPVPREFEHPRPPPRRVSAPSRPAPLRVTPRAPKSPGPGALRIPARRAQLAHTFLHHELQAAELMCWAVLAFPETPEAFRRGLLGVVRDEVRHMGMYREVMASAGARFGDEPVRDWFWERVPRCASPAHFVATMGMGLEGANLDHAGRFAERLRAAGDEAFARVQEQVLDEEVPHVRFALHWFREFTGREDFSGWRDHLPAPLSPMVMRGEPVARAARRRAGLSEEFVSELCAWRPSGPGF